MLEPLWRVNANGRMNVISISLVMPVKNGGSFIKQAIDSFLAQDQSNTWLVVADGLSTDGTTAYLEQLQNSRIIATTRADSGATEALNRIAEGVDTDVIGLLMADDLSPIGALAAVAEAFERDESLDFCIGGVDVVDVSGNERLDHIPSGEPSLGLDRILGTPYAAGIFVKTSTWRNLKGFDQRYRYGADRDFIMRLRLSGARGAALPSKVYVYRHHQGSATLGHHPEVVAAFLNDHLIMASRWLKSPVSDEDRQLISAWRRHEALSLAELYLQQRRIISILRLVLQSATIDSLISVQIIAFVSREIGKAIYGRLKRRFQGF